MVERVRVGVRNQQSGRIVGFVYYDHDAWRNKQLLIISAIDDGKKLTTGLYLPQISVTRSLLRLLFACKYPKIDYSDARLRNF